MKRLLFSLMMMVSPVALANASFGGPVAAAELEKRHERDLSSLLSATRFESKKIGEGGEISQLAESFERILQGASKVDDLTTLTRSKSSAAVAYGLIGLMRTDAGSYKSRKSEVDLSQPVSVMIGDRIGRVTLEELLKSAERGKLGFGEKIKE